MLTSRRSLLAAGAATAAIAPLSRARAQANTIKIGVLTDMSGTYRDNTGPTSVAATKEAVAEFGASHGFTVEVLDADHQNKPDVGSNIARYDQGVDLISTPTRPARGQPDRQGKEQGHINAGSRDLTGAQCAPTTIHWAYDT